MTDRQRLFAALFVKHGNGAQAAREAGYSRRSARQTAGKLLADPEIQSHIRELMTDRENNAIAEAHEVLVFLTSVMRGQVSDSFGLDPSLSDRLRAADALMKRLAVTDAKSDTLKKLDELLSEMRKEAFA